MPIDELFELAARLGADVPMCLAGRAALVSGIGEELAPAPPLPACGLLLVNPVIALPTAEVFAARRGHFVRAEPLARPWADLASLVEALAARGNELTAAATALCPAIADVLAFLRKSPAVRYAAMSGSGATCFALYDTPGAAERVAADVPAPWWRHAGTLVG
jgi:4-diphosphocytidyl-2-C-methyl-D-erythritol kinase